MDPQQGEPRAQDSPRPGSQPPPGGRPQPWVPPNPQQPGPYSQPGQHPPPAPHPQQGPYPPAGPYQQPPYPGAYPPPGQYPAPGQYPPPGGQYPPPGQPPWGGPPPYPGQFAVREPSIVAAPPSTPYHRLARTSKHRWWRPILGTLFLAAGGFFLIGGVVIAWVIAHGLLTGEVTEPSGNDFFPSDTENLAITLVMLGVLTPVVLLAAWLVQRRPAWSVASVLNRIRWRWLLVCCLPGLGYLVLSYVLGIVVEQIFPTEDPVATDSGSWVGLAAFVVPALVIIFLVPFQSAAEEFVFRGWLIQAIGSYGPDQVDGRAGWFKAVLRTPWPALVISSVAFVSAHGYTGWAMADIFLFAMTIGWLTVRTGGLEAAISLHVLNNLFAFLLPAAMGQLDGWDQQGGAPWTLLAVDLPCLALYAATIVWLTKRNRVASVSRDRVS